MVFRFGWHRLVAMTMVLTMFAAGMVPAAAQEEGPDLHLRPDEGVPGEAVSVVGHDYAPGVAGTITWESVAEPLATFTTDDDGDFEVTITVPDLPPGNYRVFATAADATTNDGFTIDAVHEDVTAQPAASPPAWLTEGTPPAARTFDDGCAAAPLREVAVATAAELEAALADARPGDRISLADGRYTGNFVAATDGTAASPIALCGSRAAIIDGGGWKYSVAALHITADDWYVQGMTVTNAQKGVMLDGASNVILDGLDVHTIGHEAVHFRTNSTDNVIANSDIHTTGLADDEFGAGVYIGSSDPDWEKYTNGEPDRSDRNQVLNNRIWNTAAESVDIKVGTEGGIVEGNQFDGAGMTGADSWVDVKGSGYVIRGNTGVNSPEDGFQTHVVGNLGWGHNNLFTQNRATIDAGGVGFYIHRPERTGNVVKCDNIVEPASAYSNLDPACTP